MSEGISLFDAAKRCELVQLQELLDRGEDPNTQEEGKLPIDYSVQRKCSTCVDALLAADSNFPSTLDEFTTEGVRQREQLRDAIDEGNEQFIKEFRDKHPGLRQCYLPSRVSALWYSIKPQISSDSQLSMYKLMYSLGFRLSESEKETLRARFPAPVVKEVEKINVRILDYHEKAHIHCLMGLSSVPRGQPNDAKQNQFEEIRKYYEELNEIPLIKSLLKAVMHCSGLLRIIYDFDSSSVQGLIPETNPNVKGITKTSGVVAIGAKRDRGELLGTVAHELAHWVMLHLYDNSFLPYTDTDRVRKDKFKEIVDQIARRKQRKKIHDVIDHAFNYDQKDWHSELIVRVPHILALNGRNSERSQDVESFFERLHLDDLYEFYMKHTNKDIEKFSQDPATIKLSHLVKELNRMHGKSQEINEYKYQVNEDRVTELPLESCIVSAPQGFFQLMEKEISQWSLKFDRLCIFLRGENLTDIRLCNDVYHKLNPLDNVKIVVSFPEKVKDQKTLNETLKQLCLERQLVVLIIEENKMDFETICKTKINRKYSWNDLSDASKTFLLQYQISYQGSSLKLEELVDFMGENGTHTTQTDTFIKSLLTMMLQNQTIEIGPKIPIASPAKAEEHNNPVFVERRLKHKETIVNGTHCRPKLKESNGHRSGIDCVNVMRHASPRIKLICDAPGSGKSTLLTHFAKKIKKTEPWRMVILINLCTKDKAINQAFKNGSSNSKAEKFILQEILTEDLEQRIFSKTIDSVVVLLDGFDEISPTYKEQTFSLIESLQMLTIYQIWVTSRPFLREELMQRFKTKGISTFSIKPITTEEAHRILIETWCTTLKLEERNVSIFVQNLTQQVQRESRDKTFLDIPLHLYILSEVYKEQVKSYCEYGAQNPQFQVQFSLLELIREFIDTKTSLCTEEKWISSKATRVCSLESGMKIPLVHQKLGLMTIINDRKTPLIEEDWDYDEHKENIDKIGIVKIEGENFNFVHRVIAEYFVAQLIHQALLTGKGMTKDGIKFIFNVLLCEPDYTVVQGFVDKLIEQKQPKSPRLKEIASVLLQSELVDIIEAAAVRFNFNLFYIYCEIVKQVLHDSHEMLWKCFCLYILTYKQLSNTITEYIFANWRWTQNDLALICGRISPYLKTFEHSLNEDKHETVLKYLGSYLNKTGFPDTMKEFLSSFCYESSWCIGSLKLFLSITKDNIAAETVKKILFLRKTDHGETFVFDVGDYEALKLLWKVAEETLKVTELKNALLHEDKEGLTIWHRVVGENKGFKGYGEHALQFLLEESKELLEDDELSNLLFGTETVVRTTVWLCARDMPTTVLWRKAKILLERQRLKQLLLSRGEDGLSIWHQAAKHSNPDLNQLKYLISISDADEILDKHELNKLLFSCEDEEGPSLLLWTTDVQICKFLWSKAIELLSRDELKTLLLSIDEERFSAFLYLFTQNDELEASVESFIDSLYDETANIRRNVWRIAVNTLEPEQLKELLQLTDERRRFIWFRQFRLHEADSELDILKLLFEEEPATISADERCKILFHGEPGTYLPVWLLARDPNSLKYLWEEAKKVFRSKDQLKSLLISTDEKGFTAWHNAVEGYRLRYLLSISEGILGDDELKSLMFSADENKPSVWLRTVQEENLRTLLKKAQELLNPLEQQRLLLSTDKNGYCPWYWAARHGDIKALNLLFEFSASVGANETLKGLLFCSETQKTAIWQIPSTIYEPYTASLHNPYTRRGCFSLFCEKALQLLCREELKALLFPDDVQETIWHTLVKKDSVRYLKMLLRVGQEFKQELRELLFLSGSNVWQVSVGWCRLTLWGLAQDILSSEELEALVSTDLDN